MAALARWCFRHRGWVIGMWALLLVGLGLLTGLVGTAYSNSFSLPGTESSKALDLLTKAFPAQAGDSDTIVWHVASGSVTDPAAEQRITRMLDQVATAPSVASVAGPYTPAGAGQISRDGRTAYATVTFDDQAQALAREDVRHVIDLAQGARAPGLEVELGGNAIEQVSQAPPSNSEGIGLLAAGIILFIAFGSLFAMVLPLVAAVVALASGILTVGLLTHWISIPVIGPTLAALIGLGVGIDYALFVVTRHRNSIKSGMSPEDAAVRSLNTSGRAVLFAGTTVCIALLGLLVLNLSFLNGLGISAAVTVLFTMAAALTLLPALLGFLGMRVLSRRERRRLAADGPVREGQSGFWTRWADFVSRHPRPLAIGATVVMLVLAIPVLSLRLGLSDAGNDSSSSTTRKAYDLLAEGFGPGFNGPLQLVATGSAQADQAALANLVATLRTEPGVAAVVAMPATPGQELSIVTVVPTSAPQDQATGELISRLRTEVIPAATAGTGLKVYVGGSTAIFGDFADVISAKLPLFIAVIVGLGFLLLMLAFRSLLVPATAAVMNLLAAGAAFGVVIGIFQFGWGSEPLGLGRADRGVPAGHHAVDPVRPVHGLPGVPRLAHARGVGPHRQEPVRRHDRAGHHRPGHHRGRGHHDLRLHRVRVRRTAGDRRVRHRARRSGVPGRVRAPDRARAGRDALVRPGQLVAARPAGPGAPAPIRRTGRRAPLPAAGGPGGRPRRNCLRRRRQPDRPALNSSPTGLTTPLRRQDALRCAPMH